jgi:hypothetical protein
MDHDFAEACDEDEGEDRLERTEPPQRTKPAPTPFLWTFAFGIILFFVGGVSMYDGYLVVRTGDMILDFEQNPVGRYLIQCNNGDPSIFLRVKAASTMVVLTVLAEMHRYSRRLASPVAFGLAVFQSALLIFLEI